MTPTPKSFLVLTSLLSLAAVSAAGAVPRAPEAGKPPADARLHAPKDLNGYFPFTPAGSRDAWAGRAEEVRRRILVSQGLWPLPTRTPLNAVIHGRIDRGDHTVEKVYFESSPGFYVTGNLYRPKNVQGRVPGVLFAHGHWKDARLSEETDVKLRAEIATGQERFEQGGRSRFQAMCVQLARMGCVVWQWDMLSDSDSRQFSAEIVHRFATTLSDPGQREGDIRRLIATWIGGARHRQPRRIRLRQQPVGWNRSNPLRRGALLWAEDESRDGDEPAECKPVLNVALAP